jgi:hypothetical protein
MADGSRAPKDAWDLSPQRWLIPSIVAVAFVSFSFYLGWFIKSMFAPQDANLLAIGVPIVTAATSFASWFAVQFDKQRGEDKAQEEKQRGEDKAQREK